MCIRDSFNTSRLGKRFVLQDDFTHKWLHVDIEVQKCNKSDYNISNEFVLVYDVQGGGKHCVYIKKKIGNDWKCLNSWGPTTQPKPVIQMDKPGNILYKVVVTFHSSQSQGMTRPVLHNYVD